MRFFLLPSPTLDVLSASVHATNSKFPEESTIQHQTTFTLQDTANTPPQMLLDNPEFTTYASSLHKKALQNGINRHILKKSLIAATHQRTLWKSQNPVASTTSNRSGTLLECLNISQKNDDIPHWAPIVTQRCSWDDKVSCSYSGCQFLND